VWQLVLVLVKLDLPLLLAVRIMWLLRWMQHDMSDVYSNLPGTSRHVRCEPCC
jgi:hypothetical protein